MKKPVKVVLWVAVGFALAGVIGISNDAQEVKKVTEATETIKQVDKPKAEKPKKKVSKENYEKIVQGDALTGAGGMTYDQVTKFLGKPKTTSESETKLGDQTTKLKVCSWSTWDMKIITISFTNGKVSSKSYID